MKFRELGYRESALLVRLCQLGDPQIHLSDVVAFNSIIYDEFDGPAGVRIYLTRHAT